MFGMSKKAPVVMDQRIRRIGAEFGIDPETYDMGDADETSAAVLFAVICAVVAEYSELSSSRDWSKMDEFARKEAIARDMGSVMANVADGWVAGNDTAYQPSSH